MVGWLVGWLIASVRSWYHDDGNRAEVMENGDVLIIKQVFLSPNILETGDQTEAFLPHSIAVYVCTNGYIRFSFPVAPSCEQWTSLALLLTSAYDLACRPH